MEKQQVVEVFSKTGYTALEETEKAIGFIASHSRRVVYLRLDSGLPSRVRVVVEPDYDTSLLGGIQGVARPRLGIQHGSNMRRFPKRLNRGEKEIHYGTPMDADTLGGLESLLNQYQR